MSSSVQSLEETQGNDLDAPSLPPSTREVQSTGNGRISPVRGCFLLMFGRLADLYGRKRMFVCGMTWLSAFSLGTSFANDAIILQIPRGLSGVGAAAQVPAPLGILAHSFPPSRARSFAFATFAGCAPHGGGTGPVFSGVLAHCEGVKA